MQYQYRATKVLLELGDIAVTDVTPTAVAGMAARLATTLAASTVDGIVTYLYSVCEDLIALGELTTNPVSAYRRIVPPRSRGGKAARKAVVLDSAHVRAVVAALGDTVFDRYITWLICLPLRVSELRGLRWANVDSKAMVIHIVEQRRHADKWTPVKPKTEGSVRSLPITSALLALAGKRRAGTELVFVNTVGHPIDDEHLRLHLDAALTACKLPYTRMHDLRHTSASNILRLGCPIDYERALLGHAPRDVTEEYARPNAEVLRPWVAAWIDVVLGEAKAKQTGT